MSGSNIVPMPNMMPAAGQMLWSNPMPPGCCPPSGMTELMKCYCDIQAATAFISKVVQDLAANDPAFQQSLVDAIVASGSNIPLLGVTNGADAQPGQVGEWVIFEELVNFAATQGHSQTITMGVIQPGDWDIWIYANSPSPVNSVNISINPYPAGMSGVPQSFDISIAGAAITTSVAPMVRLLTAVPVLLPVLIITNQQAAGPGAGTLTLFLSARRRR